MTELAKASLTLHRITIAATIDRGHLRLAEHMLADYPNHVLTALQATR